MVLPATDLRGGKRAGRGWGRPQSNKAAAKAQSWAPGAPCLEPVGEATPRAVRSVPGFLLSAREHVKVWVRVFAAPPPPSSPRSIRLERGVAKSGREGDPLETNLIGSPGQQERKPDQDMPVGGRGRGK